MQSTVDGLLDMKAVAQAVAFGNTESDEGVKAFLGKRKSNFRKR